MKVERPNARELTPEEKQDLVKLKEMVKRAMADGKLSQEEIDTIRTAVYADRKVTIEELHAIDDTIREVIGDAELEYEWD